MAALPNGIKLRRKRITKARKYETTKPEQRENPAYLPFIPFVFSYFRAFVMELLLT